MHELKVEAWNRDHLLFTGLLTLASLAAVLVQPGPTYLRMVPTTVSRALITQKLRKCLTDMTLGQSPLDKSSAEIPSSQVTLGLHGVGSKLTMVCAVRTGPVVCCGAAQVTADLAEGICADLRPRSGSRSPCLLCSALVCTIDSKPTFCHGWKPGDHSWQ